MEEKNKLMEGINKGVVDTVYDNVVSSDGGNIIIKVIAGGAILTGLAFAGVKAVKYFKQKKAAKAEAKNDKVIDAKIVNDSKKSNK